MPNIQPYLNDILAAVYGEEVRGSIHDAIEAINNEVEAAEEVKVKQSIAPTYDTVSTSTKYNIGDYVYDPRGTGYLAVCKTPTTGGLTFPNTAWEWTNIGSVLASRVEVNQYRFDTSSSQILNVSTCDDLLDPNVWYVNYFNGAPSIPDFPINGAGWIRISATTTGRVMQQVYPFDPDTFRFRLYRIKNSSTWSDWYEIPLVTKRTGTVETNPFGLYRFSSDGLSTANFDTMPLNTYTYSQFSAIKTALNNANFPLSWSDGDYVCMVKRAASRDNVNLSIIQLYNFTKTDKIEMIYFATSSGNKYRWLLPTTDLTKEHYPADAKAVGDAIASMVTESTLDGGRTGFYIKPWGGYKYSDDGLSVVDFRDMPLNTYIFTQYSVIKQGLSDTNMPETDWGDSDYIAVYKAALSPSDNVQNSIVLLYNFTKIRRLEMIYYASSSAAKYRWITPTSDFTKQNAAADAKAVGDALALKVSTSTLRAGRTGFYIKPWGGYRFADDNLSVVDFRDMPLNTYLFAQYSVVKDALDGTNMPDTDWEDGDYITMYRRAISPLDSVQNSIIELYNFSKTRHLEMIYYATSSGNKYRWLTNGVTNNNTIEYTINQYSNTYTVSAFPEITTDTNNYLNSTGDQTDMAPSIVSMLTQTGVCNLAPGDFYVSGIDMPTASLIRGSGPSTNIILLDSVTDGYTIKMGSRCTVESCSISGGSAPPNISETIGTRNGILWQGTATASPWTSSEPTRGTISNCHIKYFSGSGILCYATGTGISNCLNVANVYLLYSTVGVNISFLSEFHRFTNVDARGCYYGIINNGGNNTFANCGFSKNIVGLLMDNSLDQSRNNSHGTFSSCVFNHSGDNNNGTAIKIIGCKAGEMFVGCQVFYGEIIVENSDGIVFSSCNCHGGTSVTISSGGLVMFNGCCFGDEAPAITKTNNTATKIINCFLKDGTPVTA